MPRICKSTQVPRAPSNFFFKLLWLEISWIFVHSLMQTHPNLHGGATKAGYKRHGLPALRRPVSEGSKVPTQYLGFLRDGDGRPCSGRKQPPQDGTLATEVRPPAPDGFAHCHPAVTRAGTRVGRSPLPPQGGSSVHLVRLGMRDPEGLVHQGHKEPADGSLLERGWPGCGGIAQRPHFAICGAAHQVQKGSSPRTDSS